MAALHQINGNPINVNYLKSTALASSWYILDSNAKSKERLFHEHRIESLRILNLAFEYSIYSLSNAHKMLFNFSDITFSEIYH